MSVGLASVRPLSSEQIATMATILTTLHPMEIQYTGLSELECRNLAASNDSRFIGSSMDAFRRGNCEIVVVAIPPKGNPDGLKATNSLVATLWPGEVKTTVFAVYPDGSVSTNVRA
jgi:hypothetical protein